MRPARLMERGCPFIKRCSLTTTAAQRDVPARQPQAARSEAAAGGEQAPAKQGCAADRGKVAVLLLCLSFLQARFLMRTCLRKERVRIFEQDLS